MPADRLVRPDDSPAMKKAICAAAVVIPTTLRPELGRAVRSVFAQDLPGRVQVIVGIDVVSGERALLEDLRGECPERMRLTVIDLGYSTSRRHGGFYRNWSGGALRTLMSYAANSPYVAYLDDDNWWAPSHLSDLRAAIRGHDWAYSHRWYVDAATQLPVCVDQWESVGPGRGKYRSKQGGFVDTNCLMLDKRKCHWLLPAWCIPANSKGGGVDRTLFRNLQQGGKSGACTGKATAFYVTREKEMEAVRQFMRKASVNP